MSGEVKVGHLVIEFPDGTDKPMTVEHARELHRQLSKLFNADTPQATVYPVYVSRHEWPWWRPMDDWTKWQPHEQPRIWCVSE